MAKRRNRSSIRPEDWCNIDFMIEGIRELLSQSPGRQMETTLLRRKACGLGPYRTDDLAHLGAIFSSGYYGPDQREKCYEVALSELKRRHRLVLRTVQVQEEVVCYRGVRKRYIHKHVYVWCDSLLDAIAVTAADERVS